MAAMILVDLAGYVGTAWTLAILVFVASLPVAFLYSWTAFRGQREWLIISIVASTAFSMVGFALVWLVYVLMGKPKVVRLGEAEPRE
jgi:hypothetical protein